MMRDIALPLIGKLSQQLIVIWDYKFSLLTEVLMLGVTFVGLVFFIGEGEIDPAQVTSAFLGFLTWYYAFDIIVIMSSGLIFEAQTGTLEQLYMSTAPCGVLLLGSLLARVLLTTGKVLVLCAAYRLLFGVDLVLRWEALGVLGITLVGVIGFGYALAGASIVFKMVAPLINLVQNGLLLLNGTLLPVDRLPGWLAAFSRTLPTTRGVVMLRAILLEGKSLPALWASGDLLLLLANTAFFLLLGLSIFHASEKAARKRGLLAQY
jgi:ABC-2 type transport system permease protein